MDPQGSDQPSPVSYRPRALIARLLEAYRKAFSGLPRQVWLLSFVTLINRAGTMVMPFLSLYLSTQQGYSKAGVGDLLGLMGLGALLGATVSGWIIARLGATATAVWALAGQGVSFVVLGYLHSWGSIAALLVVNGAVGQIFRPASSSLLAEVCPEEHRMRAFALYRLAINLGVAIGPAIGGFLALVGYLWLFWIDGLTCLAASVALLLWFERKAAQQAEAEAPAGHASPWHDGTFVGMLVMTFLLGMVFLQLFTTLPVYLKQVYGFNEATIGLLFAINPVLIVIFEMLLIERLQRKNPLAIVALGALLVGLSFGMIPFGVGFAWAALFVVVMTLGEMLQSPLLVGFIANRASGPRRGRYMGAFAMTFALSFLLAPVLGMRVADSLSYQALWFGSAAVGAFAAAGFLWLGWRVAGEMALAQRDAEDAEEAEDV